MKIYPLLICLPGLCFHKNSTISDDVPFVILKLFSSCKEIKPSKKLMFFRLILWVLNLLPVHSGRLMTTTPSPWNQLSVPPDHLCMYLHPLWLYCRDWMTFICRHVLGFQHTTIQLNYENFHYTAYGREKNVLCMSD